MRGRTNLPQDIISNVEGGVSVPGIDLNLKFKPNAIAVSNDLIKIIYEGGYFVAISNKNEIAFSVDGKSWQVTRIECYELRDLIYANDEYIIVGHTGNTSNDCGLIARSKDLINWTIKRDVKVFEKSISDTLCGIAWDGNTFVIGAKCGALENAYEYIYALTSNDLITFTYKKLYSNTYTDVRSVLYQNSRFVISIYTNSTAYANNIYCSSDGVDFNSAYILGIDYLFYVDGYFFAFKNTRIGNGNFYFEFYKSINGLNWVRVSVTESLSPSKAERINTCLFINGTYIFFGQSIGFYTEDLEKLADVGQDNKFSITSSADLSSCAHNDEVIVSVGTGGVVVTADLKVEDKKITIIPSTANQECPVRLTDNIRLIRVPAVTNTIDSNIKPENIKEGISILGVAGTFNQQL